ncbi:hypothetical protein [Faecalibacter bovis]|uniref:Lipoprotein n=1 Tax=Faecalibacter bovis TaxID=2898187 RepID=A0ABX7XEQ9_9FLAO|nr:hypothetical protein [Faecalibacter bovis]QTV06356.1 hypothetical protein J9309_03200 [Faecalibacter bovis]
MKKTLLLFISIIFYGCGESQCYDFHKLVLNQQSNIIVERNYNTEKSSFALGTLKLKGKNLDTNKSEYFNPDTRGWQPFAKYISKGDTIIKRKGEAIMYIYKKDSIVSISYENFCDKTKYNQDKILNIIERESIN